MCKHRSAGTRAGIPSRIASQHQGDDMARPILFTLFLLLPDSLRAEDPPPPAENDIVPKGAKLELLYTRSDRGSGGLTEGPAGYRDRRNAFRRTRSGRAK